MNKILKITAINILSIFTLIFSNQTWASVDSDLGNFFTGLGYQNNVSAPAAYQGQAAGYYTGGSLYLRNQVRDYQIVSVEMPSFSGGCSGIDSYLGAFSVISSSQFTAMMKNILSAGGAYAFDLALTTTVPQIKSVKDYIQKYVNDINSANINSCETGEDLVGGLWPKTQESQQQICRDVGAHSGALSDWASARQDCGTGGQFNSLMGNAGSRAAETIVNKNIVWDALQKNGFSANDNELSELLMSLSGTIIIKQNADGSTQKITLASLATDRDLIKAILHGGQAEIYQCDEYTKCLNPNQKANSITISDDHALITQVSNMISQLNIAVKSDTGALSPSVRGFLEMTPIPILKFISNEAELGQPLDSTQYSEVIAISLLDQYFLENITAVKEAMAQEDTPMNSKMESEINAAQIEISQNLNTAYKKLQNTMLLVNNMRVMEQQLSSRLADRASVGQQR